MSYLTHYLLSRVDDEDAFIAPVSELVLVLVLGPIVTVGVTVVVECEVVVSFVLVVLVLEGLFVVALVVLERVRSVDFEDCLLVELLVDIFVVVLGASEVVVVRLVDILLDVEYSGDDVLDFFEAVEELFNVVVYCFEVVEVFDARHKVVFVESANRRLLIAS